jgi:hypothetical protein
MHFLLIKEWAAKVLVTVKGKGKGKGKDIPITGRGGP